MALTQDDVLDINRLYASYVQTFDQGDRDGWIDCFTSDVEYRVVPRNDTGEWSEPIDLIGHEALREYWDFRKGTYEEGTRHFSTDVLFDGDGDHATGTVQSMVVIVKEGTPVIRVTGRIEDEIVRDTDGRWRFKSRTAYPDL